MPNKYVEISEKEFDTLMSSLGFTEMCLSGTKEKVYGKAISHLFHRFSIRVYSTIENGKSRNIGSDAIRVEVYTIVDDNVIKRVGGSKRVNRVPGWQKRLTNRINKWKDAFGPQCGCGHVMIKKTPPKGKKWKPFYGCVRYPKCQGKAELYHHNQKNVTC